MFRRNRPARRAARRPAPGLPTPPLNPGAGPAGEARRAFEQATRLLAEGKYESAATHFADLAGKAAQLNRPRRMVQLNLRACEAWLAAKDAARALDHARAALRVAAERRPRLAEEMARHILDDLLAAGFAGEAEAFKHELSGRAEAPGQAAPRQARFPVTCPQCGGRLPRSYGDDEVECDYCGSIVRGQ